MKTALKNQQKSGSNQQSRESARNWEKNPRKTGNAVRNNAGIAQENNAKRTNQLSNRQDADEIRPGQKEGRENSERKSQGLEANQDEFAKNRQLNNSSNEVEDEEEDDDENITAQTALKGARSNKFRESGEPEDSETPSRAKSNDDEEDFNQQRRNNKR